MGKLRIYLKNDQREIDKNSAGIVKYSGKYGFSAGTAERGFGETGGNC
jgi:hypothetical protein